MFQINIKERKVRSDKKREVKPTISKNLKIQIERLGVITNKPVKTIGELLAYEGIHTPDVIEMLSPHFVNPVRAGEYIYFGHKDKATKYIRDRGFKSTRISIRFKEDDYGDISLLATTLDVNPSRATAIILDAAIRHVDIIESIIGKKKNTNDKQKEEIRLLMKFVNHKNPYKKKRWNTALLEVVGIVKDHLEVMADRPKLVSAETMKKMVDTETYKWEIDDVPAEDQKKVKSKKN